MGGRDAVGFRLTAQAYRERPADLRRIKRNARALLPEEHCVCEPEARFPSPFGTLIVYPENTKAAFRQNISNVVKQRVPMVARMESDFYEYAFDRPRFEQGRGASDDFHVKSFSVDFQQFD